MARQVTARKVRIEEADDRFDREFWAHIPPEQRFVETWRLSLELWQLLAASARLSQLASARRYLSSRVTSTK